MADFDIQNLFTALSGASSGGASKAYTPVSSSAPSSGAPKSVLPGQGPQSGGMGSPLPQQGGMPPNNGGPGQGPFNRFAQGTWQGQPQQPSPGIMGMFDKSGMQPGMQGAMKGSSNSDPSAMFGNMIGAFFGIPSAVEALKNYKG